MKLYEAYIKKSRYDHLVAKIESLQQSLSQYDLGRRGTNGYFSEVDVSYVPMQDFDRKTTSLVNRINTIRTELNSYTGQLERMKRAAQDRSDWYGSQIRQIEEEQEHGW